jgi:hypothetical protein
MKLRGNHRLQSTISRAFSYYYNTCITGRGKKDRKKQKGKRSEPETQPRAM